MKILSTLFFLLTLCVSAHAESAKEEKQYLFQNPVQMFQEFMKKRQEQIQAEKLKQDPNNPHLQPGIKQYFGGLTETAPVKARQKMAGLTIEIQANELFNADFTPHEIFKDEVKILPTFEVIYPSFTGRTEENFKDYFHTPAHKQKNLWLNINLEEGCWRDIRNNRYFQHHEKDEKLSLRCLPTAFLDTDFDVYGRQEPSYERQEGSIDKQFRFADKHPELSKALQRDGLTLHGFILESGVKPADERKIEEILYTIGKPYSENYEFIICHTPHSAIKKFKDIEFKETPAPHCTHYFAWQNRFVIEVRYFGEAFDKNWREIRDGTVEYLNEKIIKDEIEPKDFLSYSQWTKERNARKKKEFGKKISKINNEKGQ